MRGHASRRRDTVAVMSNFSPAIRDFIAAPEEARRLGPYRCKDLLDKAGTAPVFKAVEEHAGLSLREVAVKVFDVGQQKTGDQGADARHARIMAEARALCRVQHPNVIRFHTLATDAKRGLMGLVMELADGISLDREMEKLPRGDAKRATLAVEVGISIASALAAAHEAGVVHCNVKPSNIMFTDGTHKLINFGIAASLRSGDKEEARADSSKAPTASTDLTALGATLYQCIAGEAPGKPLAEAAPSAPGELAKLIDSLVSGDDAPRSADAVRRALERIRSALAGRDRALPAEDRGPFPGLDRYDAADRDVFFGRSAEIAGVIELARTRGLVGIVGLSGSGKSSLTRAGVVPAIEEGALGGWPTKYRSVLVTPGTDLMAALDAALSKLLDAPLAKEPEAIVQQLAADVDAKGEGLVILVDQLEEIVLKHDAKRDEARLAALDLLSRLADAPAGLRAIAVVRRDLLDGVLAVDPHFSRALSRGIQLLGPLTGPAWEEVVDQSLEAYGYRFEDDALRKDVLADLRQRETAMTLVQFGLSRLWSARDAKKKIIPRSAFSAKDGMRGALEQHADEAIASLKVPREKIRDVILAMTTPEGTRAHVELDALVDRFGEAAKDVVFALTKARLVASEKDGFTFVHDSILREWGLVRGWIADARDDRLLLAHLERDAARWIESRDPAELWRKSRLAAAVDLWKRGIVSPSDAARQFVSKSASEEGKARVMFWTLVSLVVILVVGGSLIYAKESSEHAARAQRDADALAAALAEVKALKRQADEAAMEAAATAALIQELQKKMAEQQAAYGAQVQAAVKKVSSAKDLDAAQKAAADLKAPAAPQNAVVPLPADLIGGPSAPKIDTSGPSPSAGGTFDQGAIERVVAMRKAGVKRVCLERSSSTASSTKITATLTIAPNGAVQSVSSVGDEPVVAKCIEQQLRNWSFPPPGETKTVQIPFVFVRQ
jgi:serine/threonine protein kinase